MTNSTRAQALFTSEHAQQAVVGWYADPGHAWLAVQVYGSPDAFDDALRFASQFSYVDFANGIVYLEEDEDAPRFIKRYGIELANLPYYSVDEESEVRNLPRGTHA